MNSIELESIISKNIMFKGLTPLEQKKVLFLAEELEIKLGIRSIPCKIAHDTIYIVCRGEMLVNAIDLDDNASVVRTIHAGEIWLGGELDQVTTKKITLNVPPQTLIVQLRLLSNGISPHI